jgi:hypothetical protein
MLKYAGNSSRPKKTRQKNKKVYPFSRLYQENDPSLFLNFEYITVVAFITF